MSGAEGKTCFVCWLEAVVKAAPPDEVMAEQGPMVIKKESRKPEYAICLAFQAGRMSMQTGVSWHACHEHLETLGMPMGQLAHRTDPESVAPLAAPPTRPACHCGPTLQALGVHTKECPERRS